MRALRTSTAPVRAVLTTVALATPGWLATRPLLAPNSTAPPARCAAMPARLTGQAAVGAVLAVLEAVVAVQLGLVVQVDGIDCAQLVAGRVDHGPTLPALDGLDARWHAVSLLITW